MWSNRHDESGVALVFSLIAVLVIGGLIVVMVARALAEQGLTADEAEFESAIHIAEAGIDDVIQEVNDDNDFLTEAPATATPTTPGLFVGGEPHQYPLATTATNAAQFEWALSIAEEGGCTLVDYGEGEACGIRPYIDLNANGTADRDEEQLFMFGIGYEPSRAAPDRTVRAIKITFDNALFAVDDAVRTNDVLNLTGSSLTVTGTVSNVHTNAEFSFSGSGCPTIDGTVTFEDPVTGACGAVQGPQKDLPPILALDYYERSPDYVDCITTSCTGVVYDGEWYDMCPDGTVQAPDVENGTVAGTFQLEASFAPCDGDNIITSTGVWRGWEWDGSQWEIPNNSTVSPADGEGIFYFHHSNVDLRGGLGSPGNPVRATMITSAADVCGTSDGSVDGSITLAGNVYVEALLTAESGSGIQFITDRDVYFTGASSGTLSGFVGAHEQLQMSGNSSLNGAIFAEDACHTAGSPVDANLINGSVTIVNDSVLVLDGDGKTRVTAWSELFG